MHRVVHAEFLPLFQSGRGIDFFPSLIVNQLVLRSGDIRNLEFRILDHVVEHSAVSSVREFPVPREFKILVLLVRDDVA